MIVGQASSLQSDPKKWIHLQWKHHGTFFTPLKSWAPFWWRLCFNIYAWHRFSAISLFSLEIQRCQFVQHFDWSTVVCIISNGLQWYALTFVTPSICYMFSKGRGFRKIRSWYIVPLKSPWNANRIGYFHRYATKNDLANLTTWRRHMASYILQIVNMNYENKQHCKCDKSTFT